MKKTILIFIVISSSYLNGMEVVSPNNGSQKQVDFTSQQFSQEERTKRWFRFKIAQATNLLELDNLSKQITDINTDQQCDSLASVVTHRAFSISRFILEQLDNYGVHHLATYSHAKVYADISNGRNNLLIKALQQKNIPAALLLINNGMSVERPDFFTGDAPLHLACRLGLLPVARCLLQRGASTETVNRSQIRPLVLAASRPANERSIVPLLLLYKSFIDAGNRDGVIALSGACENNNTKLVQYLLTRNANKDIMRRIHKEKGLLELTQEKATGLTNYFKYRALISLLKSHTTPEVPADFEELEKYEVLLKELTNSLIEYKSMVHNYERQIEHVMLSKIFLGSKLKASPRTEPASDDQSQDRVIPSEFIELLTEVQMKQEHLNNLSINCNKLQHIIKDIEQLDACPPGKQSKKRLMNCVAQLKKFCDQEKIVNMESLQEVIAQHFDNY